MRAKEIFGLILRVVGLLGLLYGGFYLLSCVYCFTGVPERQGFGAQQYFVAGVVYVAVGLYFLRGAPHIFRLAYGPPNSPSNQQGGADEEQPSTPEVDATPETAAPHRSP